VIRSPVPWSSSPTPSPLAPDAFPALTRITGCLAGNVGFEEAGKEAVAEEEAHAVSLYWKLHRLRRSAVRGNAASGTNPTIPVGDFQMPESPSPTPNREWR